MPRRELLGKRVNLQNRKDYPIIVVGASLLSMQSGFVNAVTIIAFGSSVGSTNTPMTRVGIAMYNGEMLTFHFLAIIMFFFLGASMSAAIIGKSTFKITRPYNKMIICEGLLLVASSVALAFEKELVFKEAVMYPLALACGIQNALCTTWSGTVVRTTHYTPAVTDLGIVIGNWLRGKLGWRHKTESVESDLWKISLFIPLLIGGLIGAYFGAVCFYYLHYGALALPGVALTGIGILYRIISRRRYWQPHVGKLLGAGKAGEGDYLIENFGKVKSYNTKMLRSTPFPPTGLTKEWHLIDSRADEESEEEPEEEVEEESRLEPEEAKDTQTERISEGGEEGYFDLEDLTEEIQGDNTFAAIFGIDLEEAIDKFSERELKSLAGRIKDLRVGYENEKEEGTETPQGALELKKIQQRVTRALKETKSGRSDGRSEGSVVVDEELSIFEEVFDEEDEEEREESTQVKQVFARILSSFKLRMSGAKDQKEESKSELLQSDSGNSEKKSKRMKARSQSMRTKGSAEDSQLKKYLRRSFSSLLGLSADERANLPRRTESSPLSFSTPNLTSAVHRANAEDADRERMEKASTENKEEAGDTGDATETTATQTTETETKETSEGKETKENLKITDLARSYKNIPRSPLSFSCPVTDTEIVTHHRRELAKAEREEREEENKEEKKEKETENTDKTVIVRPPRPSPKRREMTLPRRRNYMSPRYNLSSPRKGNKEVETRLKRLKRLKRRD
eukprot:TRINITY_DN4632_c1_g2_i11.p1 TRINITY_DN4632_c1_g2~~TRINITY_DN4632_c1_g2_i11.p1  ORF type:complete len:739 (+),score=221.35 TRINITY_DN4632_c1_g2_i11:118-2334(+)